MLPDSGDHYNPLDVVLSVRPPPRSAAMELVFRDAHPVPWLQVVLQRSPRALASQGRFLLSVFHRPLDSELPFLRLLSGSADPQLVMDAVVEVLQEFGVVLPYGSSSDRFLEAVSAVCAEAQANF